MLDRLAQLVRGNKEATQKSNYYRPKYSRDSYREEEPFKPSLSKCKSSRTVRPTEISLFDLKIEMSISQTLGAKNKMEWCESFIEKEQVITNKP